MVPTIAKIQLVVAAAAVVVVIVVFKFTLASQKQD